MLILKIILLKNNIFTINLNNPQMMDKVCRPKASGLSLGKIEAQQVHVPLGYNTIIKSVSLK